MSISDMQMIEGCASLLPITMPVIHPIKLKPPIELPVEPAPIRYTI